MSEPAESRPTGVIPSFPFQETGGVVNALGAGGGGGKAPPDFDALRAALDAAVRALRSFQEYVGVLEQQQQGVRGAAISAASRPVAGMMDKPLGGPLVAPREVFPRGQMEAGVPGRAVLTEGQQAQLDAALAQAFAIEPVAPPKVAATMVAAPAPGVPPPLVATPMVAGVTGVHPPVSPASAALMAAAPPLPGSFAVEMPPAFVPPAAPALPSEPMTLPFSPFQGLPPAPPSPSVGPSAVGSSPETTWPSSPFFGAAQATTAPFRVVEPPPVVSTAPQEVASARPPVPPAVATAPPVPAAFPPVPEEGQVFNFAELLRANGQR